VPEPRRVDGARGGPRAGYRYEHRREVVVAAPIDATFAFLADPPLLEPRWTSMQFVPGTPRDLGPGSEREYVFRWAGIPVYFRIRAAEYEPPFRLTLEQVLGPWQSHVRRITLSRDGAGTRVTEHDEVCAPPGVVDHVMHRFVVARQLAGVGAFRRDALLRHLGTPSTVGAASRE
jgi:uncharacterized protein YndB with AHSA1/START domain